jgi:phosphohistidine phosphatase
MRTLWLLRHAKASAGAPDLPDHERPLEERGADAARRMGRDLVEQGFAPAWTLCSTAIRARQTLGHLSRGLGVELEAELDRNLYLATADELATCIRRVPDDVTSLLLVGHNPGIGELAAALARRGERALRAALRQKFPTCALAELRLETAHWRQLSDGAELVSYRTPRTLDASSGGGASDS